MRSTNSACYGCTRRTAYCRVNLAIRERSRKDYWNY